MNSLYAVYEHASEGFAERYLAMLAAGGTKHHSELLAPFGLDARDPGNLPSGIQLLWDSRQFEERYRNITPTNVMDADGRPVLAGRRGGSPRDRAHRPVL